jgi:DNA invertase Pin-like site-specific DNA recombinase
VTQQPTQKKRAVIYLRVRCIGGSDEGVDAHLARQRDDCTRVAELRGVSVIREYEAIGGVRDVHVRAIVRDMLDHAAAARADYIITSGFDRLCRGPVEAERELLRAIRETGAVLLCGNAWDVSALLGPTDDVLAETHRAIVAGRPA